MAHGNHWRYWLRPAASYLPESLLRQLHRRLPLLRDPADGWTFWLDASYYRWCRVDRRRNG